MREPASYRVKPAATADMLAIVDYLREHNPVAAVRFVEAAQATFEHLTRTPYAYPTASWESSRLSQMRWRPLTGAFRSYLVFYQIAEGDIVEVVRVLHSARDIESLLIEA